MISDYLNDQINEYLNNHINPRSNYCLLTLKMMPVSDTSKGGTQIIMMTG